VNLKDDLGHLTPGLRRYARALVNGSPAPSELADDLVHGAILRMLETTSASRGADLAPRLYASITQIHRERRRANLFAPRAAARAQGRYAGAPAGTSVGRDKAIRRERLPGHESASSAGLPAAGLCSGLDALGLDEREVLLLVALESLSYGDVGRVLRISRAMLIGRLARARARLCEALGLAPGRGKVTHLRLVKSDSGSGHGRCPSVDDEDLHSYVDGEATLQRQTVIAAYLADAPLDAQRVEAWRRQNELIRTAFAKVEVEQVPVSLSLAQIGGRRGTAGGFAALHSIGHETWTSLPPPLPKRPRLSMARLPGAFLGGFCLGATLLFALWHWPVPDQAVLGSLSEDGASPSIGLTRRAITALHARAAHVLGTNASASVPRSAQDKMQAAPDLSSEGWSIIGAGVIDDAQAISCFTYAGGDEVLAFCVQPRLTAIRPGLSSLDVETAGNLAIWRDSSAIYALAATVGGSSLRHLVARMRMQTR